MKYSLIILIGFQSVYGWAQIVAAACSNVLFILVDDMGIIRNGCASNGDKQYT